MPLPKQSAGQRNGKNSTKKSFNTGLCTGCAGCVVTCPHDVIGYEHEEGKYKPFHIEEELGLDNCIHGEKGCTTCTRACPRFSTLGIICGHASRLVAPANQTRWPASGDNFFSLVPLDTEVQHEKGQDGGFVSAMLIWLAQERLHRWRTCQRSRRQTMHGKQNQPLYALRRKFLQLPEAVTRTALIHLLSWRPKNSGSVGLLWSEWVAKHHHLP